MEIVSRFPSSCALNCYVGVARLSLIRSSYDCSMIFFFLYMLCTNIGVCINYFALGEIWYQLLRSILLIYFVFSDVIYIYNTFLILNTPFEIIDFYYVFFKLNFFSIIMYSCFQNKSGIHKMK